MRRLQLPATSSYSSSGSAGATGSSVVTGTGRGTPPFGGRGGALPPPGKSLWRPNCVLTFRNFSASKLRSFSTAGDKFSFANVTERNFSASAKGSKNLSILGYA